MNSLSLFLSVLPSLSCMMLRGRVMSYSSLICPVPHSTGTYRQSLLVDRALCVNPTRGPSSWLPHPHAWASCCTGGPSHLVPHPVSGGHIFSMYFSQNPGLVNSPLWGAECPELVAGHLGLPMVSYAPATPIPPPPAWTAPKAQALTWSGSGC